ncbi:MAG: hypothetical protein GPJ54_04710 [Candidatus Heimdallarchaeota archaeon]|nr:hypothetical protein [Candidatus Heimdallarchaeota archaeon]
MSNNKPHPPELWKKYLRLVILEGIVYIVLQASLYFLNITPYTDYFNHINWGIGYDEGLYPYKDYHANEYPVLSVWGWIFSYRLSPKKTYIWLSIMMNLPYWILAWFGGMAFYSILTETELQPKQAFLMTTFFYFLPLNLIDTINNHGGLGTSSTVIIAIYLLRKNKYFWSAALLAAGFSIKIYPIFIAPFMVYYSKSLIARVKYSIYTLVWILLYHIPIISIFNDYFDVLFWRTTQRDGITYSFIIELIFEPLGNDHLPTLVWLLMLGITAAILLFEDNLPLLDKYAVIIMINNLFEPRGGIGHIATTIPIMGIYFFYKSEKLYEKRMFVAYVIIASFWGFGRFIVDPDNFTLIQGAILLLFMILSTTIIFILYLRGLMRNDKIELVVLRKLKLLRSKI